MSLGDDKLEGDLDLCCHERSDVKVESPLTMEADMSAIELLKGKVMLTCIRKS